MTSPLPVRVEADHAHRYKGADKLATECVVNLVRTGSLLAAELDRTFRRYGITGPGVNVLMILDGAGEPLPPNVIGERRLVTRGTVTGLLDTLEKQRLVRRTRHPGDRRMLLVELTDEARDVLAKLRAELFPAQAEMIAGLSEHEKDTLVRLLGKLQTHLESRRRSDGMKPTPAE